MNEKACVNSLVAAVRYDISRGMKREEVLSALSNVVGRDIVSKVKDQV